ncbi:hypothetical protein AB0368_31050 [Actinoplanes sp. NPDC051475]|uniref:hypothetical protein n=1 Tax=Actinoplanes sp. NPDC051475 TaxID=3157225 RepID=UPI00344D20AB
MRLTGIPLILLAGGLAAGALTVTVRTWSRGGLRRRVVMRTVGLVFAELLVVTTAGLIVNRYQAFYPSWRDLTGGGTEAVVVVAPSDRPRGERPPGEGIVVPVGYAERPHVTFPVIVVLCRPADVEAVRAAARVVPDVVTVAFTPREATEVTRLIGRLPRLARVTGHARALVADRPHRELARRLGEADLDVTTVVTATGGWDAALAEAADRLPAPLVAPLRP